MWDDANQLVVGSGGQVSFAPVGTTLPTDPTSALDSAFTGTGFLTEDGVTPTFGQEITEFGAWQSAEPIRRSRQTQKTMFAFSMQQWNEGNLVLAIGGEVEEPSVGVFKYLPPEVSDALDEWSLVVDVEDGDVHQRFVVPRGNSTDDVASSFKRTETGVLPVTFKTLTPEGGGRGWYLLSDAPGFATGS